MALPLIIPSATVGLRTEHYAASAVVGALILVGGRAYEALLLYWPVPATGLATALALIGLGWRWVLPTAAMMVLVGSSALYMQHHYLIDGIAGGACAAMACAIARFGVDRRLVLRRRAR